MYIYKKRKNQKKNLFVEMRDIKFIVCWLWMQPWNHIKDVQDD